MISIDGSPITFQWFDLVSALAILGLLAVIFWMSLVDSPRRE
ncbi:hypothetical protein [Mycobacterium sp. GA-1199]|nr:hypothetical protein [Mycobacterium sp. GA-1199]